MQLRVLRERRGLSLRKLGALSGVHYISIVRIESGTLDPRLSTLRRLAEALGVTLSELAGEQPSTTASAKGGKTYGTHKKKG